MNSARWIWILAVLWLATAQTSGAQPAPHAAVQSADLTGVWSNASLTLLQRAGLLPHLGANSW